MDSEVAATAVVGVVGVLGTMAGVVIATRSQRGAETRDLERRVSAAARLLMDDYYNAQTALAHAVTHRRWWPEDLDPAPLAEPQDVRLLVASVEEGTSRRILGAYRRRREVERARAAALAPPVPHREVGDRDRMRALAAFYDLDAARAELGKIGGIGFDARRRPNGVTAAEEHDARRVGNGDGTFDEHGARLEPPH